LENLEWNCKKSAGSGCLEFGVGVGADFAVQVDFFVLWCGPFHGRDSLGVIEPFEDSTERKERKVEMLTPVVRGSFKHTKNLRRGSERTPRNVGSEKDKQHNGWR
jgi:hypothetical protein